MRLALILVAVVVCLASCTTPVQVTPQPDIAAVRKQNEQTKQHVDKVRISQGDAGKHLDSAVQALDELLKE